MRSDFVANTERLEDVFRKTETVGLVHLGEFKKGKVREGDQLSRTLPDQL